jgi:hypothetical protein
MPQCRQMRTCAQSRPPSRVPNQHPTPGVFKKSSFCHGTQAGQDRKNTPLFPGFLGFLTPHSRVPALYPGISQHHGRLTLLGIQTNSVGQPGKNIKFPNELNPTQENSEARSASRSRYIPSKTATYNRPPIETDNACQKQGTCICLIRAHLCISVAGLFFLHPVRPATSHGRRCPGALRPG